MKGKNCIIISLFIIVFCLQSVTCTAVPYSVTFIVDRNSYVLNGKETTMDAVPHILNNRAFIPIRYLALSLGIKQDNIVWNSSTRDVKIVKDNMCVELKMGSNIYYVNDQPREMDTIPIIRDGHIYLPARYVAEPFGYEVRWNVQRHAVIITQKTSLKPDKTQAETIISLAKEDLSKRLGFPENKITLKSIESVNWPDSSLGYPKPNKIYGEVVTPGYRIILRYNDNEFEYHSNMTGSVIVSNK
ncbi:stalk domain-containing protein [Desulfoscipio gibsoniae]|uniref:Copper amine oxidase family protein n=1 Tax=Desulfoscipio gibsoniae DSM 7213 TaxID=767817 RepID=R4KVN9_9FIRM|nr:copper amine oxidase N-terminal domain-containing protein [Desulfoscipio gibsoniae]AGL03691.1 copper amine oxidase family protein [Desulfoscipio gibsoniae DSM 7213]